MLQSYVESLERAFRDATPARHVILYRLLRAVERLYGIDPATDENDDEDWRDRIVALVDENEERFTPDDEDEEEEIEEEEIEEDDEPIAGSVEFRGRSRPDPGDDEEEDITLVEIVKMLDDFSSMEVFRVLRTKYPPLMNAIEQENAAQSRLRTMLVDTCTVLQSAGLSMPETVKAFWEVHEEEAMRKHEREREKLEAAIAKGDEARRKLQQLTGVAKEAVKPSGKIVRRIAVQRGRNTD